jgi:DNA-binding beta-propeller fold protein YncE
LLLLVALPSLAAAQSPVFPALVSLPTGWAPEGVANGRGATFYSGSLSGMGIYRGDLRTGLGAVLPGTQGRAYTGMKVDPRTNYLFVAGAASGQAYVFDDDTGAEIAVLQLAPAGDFINDVIITRDAAYFTNSSAPVFYKVPLGPGGALSTPVMFDAIPLTGDWQQGAGFGANGIDATPDGRYLIIVHTSEGKLYRVDPVTGYANPIDLGGESVTFGDGILLAGQTLYVVRNQLNKIAVFSMAPDFLSGQLVDTLTNANFNVPTTIARFGDYLYAVNAKFGTPPQGTSYEVVQVRR